MGGRAKAIREELKIRPDREEWMTPERKNSEARKGMVLLRRMLNRRR